MLAMLSKNSPIQTFVWKFTTSLKVLPPNLVQIHYRQQKYDHKNEDNLQEAV
jgi:hypothetical protein